MSIQSPRVAICQPVIILGGRLSVIIGIIKILNELNIVPDILTTQIKFKPEDIEKKYGKNIKVNYRFVASPRIQRGEWKTLGFNTNLKKYAPSYDLLINTSNSLALLPPSSSVLTYMFYPRKSRIDAEVIDIHFPENRLMLFSKKGINRFILRRVYQRIQVHTQHQIIAMTDFTKKALRDAYPNLPLNPEIIYPAVDMDSFWYTGAEKQNHIVTIGRFSRDKRQLTQIQLAQRLPNFEFHIFGFTGHGAYFEECRQYVETHNIQNVYLHPNAPFSEMLTYLQNAKYFLHTLINEPFGLTAVQAMAAGALPLVPNSGGQIETVILPELRYDNFDDVPDRIQHLESLSGKEIDNMRTQLQNHIREAFDESVFHQKMKAVLLDILQEPA
jgi:glycosyltransferase involved in cell wall biosynthesis